MISAYGLAVDLALPVPELEPVVRTLDGHIPPGPVLRVELAEPEELDREWSGGAEPPAIARAFVDGSDWTAERGAAGDVRMDHPLARFHLNRGAALLRCAPADRDDAAWRRLLLDTALVTVSLVCGHDALHAGCVVTGGRAAAIAGARGSGKTSLLLELMRRGASFLADDVVMLRVETDAVMALPAPPLVNLPTAAIAGGLAEPLHGIGDECWARIHHPYAAPAPLHTVLVLERTAGAGDATITSLREPAAALLVHALQSGARPERREERFAVLSQLARTAEVIGVTATGTSSPSELAEQLIAAVPALRS